MESRAIILLIDKRFLVGLTLEGMEIIININNNIRKMILNILLNIQCNLIVYIAGLGFYCKQMEAQKGPSWFNCGLS